MTSATDQSRLQVIVSLASAGDLDGAATSAASILDKGLAAEAWRCIGRANANMQRWETARLAYEKALGNAPESRELRLESALLADARGLHAEALAGIEALARDGIDSPQLLVHYAGALQLAGREEEAEQQLETGLARWPADIPLHRQLVQLRWRRGAGAGATDRLERAITEQPRELALRLVAADLLRNAGFPERALTLLEAGLAQAPGSVAFLTSTGVVFDELGRNEEALRHLRAALALAPQSPAARRNLVPSLLRVGETREALSLLEGLIAQTPEDQQLVAWRATALRVAGDPEYSRLHDYPRLVRSYALQPPARYEDIAAFNAQFARELTALHRSQRRPLAQSLRGGSQTERNLPMDDAAHPAIAAFFRMLTQPIDDYLSRLATPDHPVDRRRRAGYRFAGSWSVQLEPGGFHTNHVHPQGWLSSAYYVELPDDGAAGGSSEARAGWLKFGEPAMPRPVCGPDYFVEPEAGTLVLFPSYMWHGTVPFSNGGRRLTAAFDLLPV